MSFWRVSPNLNVGDMLDGYRVVAVRMTSPPSIVVANHGQRRHGLTHVPEVAERFVQLVAIDPDGGLSCPVEGFVDR